MTDARKPSDVAAVQRGGATRVTPISHSRTGMREEILRRSHFLERLGPRNLHLTFALAVVASFLAVLLAPGPASAGDSYTVQNLGVLTGRDVSEAYAINASGQTVGESWKYGALATDGFVTDGTSMTELVDPWSDYPQTNPSAISSANEIVGSAIYGKGGQTSHAFLYNGTSFQDLGTLTSKGSSGASDINNHDIAVGRATARDGTFHAVLWNGRIQDLGTLPGHTYSEANAVNNLGQAVGDSWNVGTTAQDYRAFYYNGTSMQDIGTLGGAQARAFDINDYDETVGSAQTAGGVWDAFVYANGTMSDIGPGQANAINFYHQVVGQTDPDWSNNGGFGGHAFLYQDGYTVDLNSLIPASSGWDLLTATDINNVGQIVGTGLFNGQYRAYRLNLTLLGKWAPMLRYDVSESYFAASAAEITDNYEPGGSSNLLLDGNNGIIAAADPSYPEDDLSLGYLSSTYPGGAAAASGDHIDEVDNYAVDAQRLQALPEYANQIYGREFDYPNEKVLQYWFFYYYNGPMPFGIDNHEGDWEMIQVHLDLNGNPTEVTAAQHDGGERCDWVHVQRTSAGHPIIYVARHSHASFFSSGEHLIEAGAYDDYAGGNGLVAIPAVDDLASFPAWLLWPGKWGGSGASPVGPMQHGTQWLDPQSWSDGVSGCTEGQTYGAASKQSQKRAQPKLASASQPALPLVHARRVGSRAVIVYTFPTLPKSLGLRPRVIYTSVDSYGKKYAPLTVASTIHGRRGRVVQPVGLGHGPFRILVSVISRNGRTSRTIAVPLR